MGLIIWPRAEYSRSHCETAWRKLSKVGPALCGVKVTLGRVSERVRWIRRFLGLRIQPGSQNAPLA